MTKTILRSVRIAPDAWEEAGRRAKAAGLSLNAYVVERISGELVKPPELPLGPGGDRLVITGCWEGELDSEKVQAAIEAYTPSSAADFKRLLYGDFVAADDGSVQAAPDDYAEATNPICDDVPWKAGDVPTGPLTIRGVDLAKLTPGPIRTSVPASATFGGCVGDGKTALTIRSGLVCFPCGHPRELENLRRAGKNADGSTRFACKTCRKANDEARDRRKVKP